jgi:hypothetical protein
MMKKSGVKKYNSGGPKYTGGRKFEGPVSKETTDAINRAFPETNVPFVYDQNAANADVYKRQTENFDRIPDRKSKGGATKKYMTGGMVNPNAKVSALKKAGSKGVKSGVNPKASASKVAKGRSGGTSKAPKDATPKKNKKG